MFNRFRAVTVMIFQAAFVTAQLLIHFLAALLKCGVNFMGMGACLCCQAGGKMYNRFTGIFTCAF
jgi:hypothetical protein